MYELNEINELSGASITGRKTLANQYAFECLVTVLAPTLCSFLCSFTVCICYRLRSRFLHARHGLRQWTGGRTEWVVS
jgi:hypothetical protein